MRNEEGYEKAMKLCAKLENKEVDFAEFIAEFEIIAFNDFSAISIDHFADGWTKASVSTLMKYFIKAYNGDEKAERRLKIDLELEEANFTIKKVE